MIHNDMVLQKIYKITMCLGKCMHVTEWLREMCNANDGHMCTCKNINYSHTAWYMYITVLLFLFPFPFSVSFFAVGKRFTPNPISSTHNGMLRTKSTPINNYNIGSIFIPLHELRLGLYKLKRPWYRYPKCGTSICMLFFPTGRKTT